ncbi:MAG: hypothetical protein K8J08_22300 [Thermoanaerobaculia bacterium]|nr:hypothetical protein [Thermoanaerobaculia bacterium]
MRKAHWFTLLVLAMTSGALPVAAQFTAAHWAMEPWTQDTGVLDNSYGSDSELGSDGTMIGFPEDGSEWVLGVVGRALQFDGVNRYVTHTVPLWESPERIIAHWIRSDVDDQNQVAVYESDAPGNGADYNGFGSAGDALEIHTGIANDQFYGLIQNGLGPANTPGSGVRTVSGGTVVPGRWTHVAMTWDLAGDLKLYVDCVLVDSVSLSDASFFGHGATEHLIGSPSDPSSRRLRGALDDVRVEFFLPTSDEALARRFCSSRRYESSDLTAQAMAPDDAFGSRMAMDENWLIIGSASGIHWYRRGDTAVDWDFHHSAELSPGKLALDGSTAVVGTRIYEQDQGGPDAWGETALLAAEVGDVGGFGASISVHGDLVAVGSPNSVDGGSAYIFGRDQGGPGAWGQTHREVSETSESFGRDLEIDGTLLAVGSRATEEQSRVDLFAQDQGGAGNWGSVGQVSAGFFDADGWNLDLRGDGLVVANGFVGSVSVFRQDLGGPNAWGLEGELQASEQYSADFLGGRVHWISDELIAAASTSCYVEGNVICYEDRFHEAIYLFQRNNAGEWNQRQILLPTKFSPSHERAFNLLGLFSLAGSEDVLLAGAPLNGTTVDGPDPGEIVDAGRVVLFTLPFFSDGFESGDTGAW